MNSSVPILCQIHYSDRKSIQEYIQNQFGPLHTFCLYCYHKMPMFQVSELRGIDRQAESCHRVSSLWSTLSFLILIVFRFIFTFVLHVLIFCLHVRMCITRMPGTGGGQKTASDPRNWRHRQLWLTMWVLWKSPPKKQPVLLTDGSSIQLCLRTLVMTVLKCTPVC